VTDPQVSVCIPVAEYHKDVLPRAVASVKAQTIETRCLYVADTHKRGPGWARNKILEHVDTPFVVFLDADDWLEPQFVEVCLNQYQPGRYVYTDWWQDDDRINAPNKPWCNGTWHVNAALLRTEDVRTVNGFNEDLSALEDTDFWLKLTARKICGIRVPAPLFHYGKEGRRARDAIADGRSKAIREQLLERYGNTMGCCGGQDEIDYSIPVGEKQPGDVLAEAVWRGNRPEYGRATGRRYPRMSAPKRTWVAPADIIARPDHWKQVIEPTITDVQPQHQPRQQPPRYQGIEGLAQAMDDAGILSIKQDVAPRHAATPLVQKPNPDIGFVVDIAQERLK
jgi:hypothetical protein